MTTKVKICGLSTAETLTAACAGGAAYLGFNFFEKSPRYVTFAQARGLATEVPSGICRVGLLVDPGDETVKKLLADVPLDMLQLHGEEPPQRVAEVRQRFGLPVMKVVKIAGPDDVARAERFFPVADHLLFDTKAPKSREGMLPGGNAIAFDWRLLAGRDWPLPWMLAGGLSVANLAEAVRISGAKTVDVSSGVESSRGVKSVERIKDFLALADSL